MWDLWWTKWHWDRLLSEFFGFTQSISFHRGSPFTYIAWGIYNRLDGGRSSEIFSNPIIMENNNNVLEFCVCLKITQNRLSCSDYRVKVL
jgi:hypothetical protein